MQFELPTPFCRYIAQSLDVDASRQAPLHGSTDQLGSKKGERVPKVTQHATQETPTIENFLYFFFSPSEKSQAAGRSFWNRRHTRVDRDVPSFLAAMQAQAAAISEWGVVPKTDSV
jgi:hypothetical protein